MVGFLDKGTGLPYFWSKLKALFAGKADKVSGATNGNLAGLDANGNLTDSGHKHSDYMEKLIYDPNDNVASAGGIEAYIDATVTSALTASY